MVCHGKGDPAPWPRFRETSAPGEVHMLLLSDKRSAVSVAAAVMAMAAIADAAAAQPNRPVMAQHAAPNHGAAPVFQTAPVQRVAPHVVMPPATRPVYPNTSRPVGVMPTFPQPQNNT